VGGEVSATFGVVLVGVDLEDEVFIGEFGEPALYGPGGGFELFGEGAIFVPADAFASGLADDGDEEEFRAKLEVLVLDSFFDEHSGSGARDVEVREEEE